MPSRPRSGRPDPIRGGTEALIAAVVTDAARRGRWSALGAAGRALADSIGVGLDESGLRLYVSGEADAGAASSAARPPVGDAAPEPLAAAFAMGACLEALLAPGERDAGAHHTPPWLAEQVVELALDGLGPDDATTVCDPACGGGVFAAAAAEALLRRRVGGARSTTVDRAEIARSVWAFDVDPLAVAVTEVALALWAGSDVDGPRGRLVDADFLLDPAVEAARPVDGWDVVVGNPPFQSQLTTATARSRDRAARLRARFDAAAGGYVDESALFVLAGVEGLGPGGRLAMVVPTALASTAHAAPVREALAQRAALSSLWVPDEQPFAAAVDVMVPVFAAGRPPATTTVHRPAEAPSDEDEPASPVEVPDPGPAWADLLATAWGVPFAPLGSSGGTLGDLAAVTAGFRQHFYAIAEAVRDRDREQSEPTDRPVLTVGLVDPLRNRWGRTTTRIGGTTYRRPVLDGTVVDAEVAEWLDARRRPKVLVATQTRVLEAAVDEQGDIVPSTPLISVEPHDPDDVWLVGAALCAPPLSAWLHRRAAGAGLSRDRVRPTASLLRDAPLPENAARWSEGADLARRISSTGDPVDHRRLLLDLGRVMADAYGAADGVTDWWAARLPRSR